MRAGGRVQVTAEGLIIRSPRNDGTVSVELEPRPDVETEAQAAISADIDAIVKRLDAGIPRLDARLDALLERQRRPLTV